MPDEPLPPLVATERRSCFRATLELAWGEVNTAATSYATDSGAPLDSVAGKYVLFVLLLFTFLCIVFGVFTGTGFILIFVLTILNKYYPSIESRLGSCWDNVNIFVAGTSIESIMPYIETITPCCGFSIRQVAKRIAAGLLFAIFTLVREFFSKIFRHIAFITIFFVFQHNDLMLTFNVLSFVVYLVKDASQETDPRKVYDAITKSLGTFLNDACLKSCFFWLVSDEEDMQEGYTLID